MRALVGWLVCASVCSVAAPAVAAVWQTTRPHKAVVIGGSISRFYAGNFGQFLQAGCSQLEVINRGEVGAGGAKLLRNLQQQVLGEPGVRAGLGQGWILFQGGLNSIWSAESTIWFTSRLMVHAHEAGLRVMALSLTPWGSEDDKRFAGWKGLRFIRNSALAVEYLFNRVTPQQVLGRRLAQRKGDPKAWDKTELADIAVDLWNSPLRVGDAATLRERGPLEASFAHSPFAKRTAEREALIEAARAVPRNYLLKQYHSFDHTHPNTAGHRLMASLACQQAPAEWGCDCDAIRRAVWQRGKVVVPP